MSDTMRRHIAMVTKADEVAKSIDDKFDFEAIATDHGIDAYTFVKIVSEELLLRHSE